MTSAPVGRPGAAVVSFHRLRLRPASRWSDLRLLLFDHRATRRANPGLLYMAVGISGAAHRGLGGVPHPLVREVIAFWRDEDSYQAFLAGTVMTRWTRTAEVFTVHLEPVSGRGHWDHRDLLAGLPTSAKLEGPLAVISFVKLPVRAMLPWYTRIVPQVSRHMAGAQGLIAGTGGADLFGRTTFTVTFWSDSRSMLANAYGKDHAHGQHVGWGKTHLDASFAHFTIGAAQGSWDHQQPLHTMMKIPPAAQRPAAAATSADPG